MVIDFNDLPIAALTHFLNYLISVGDVILEFIEILIAILEV